MTISSRDSERTRTDCWGRFIHLECWSLSPIMKPCLSKIWYPQPHPLPLFSTLTVAILRYSWCFAAILMVFLRGCLEFATTCHAQTWWPVSALRSISSMVFVQEQRDPLLRSCHVTHWKKSGVLENALTKVVTECYLFWSQQWILCGLYIYMYMYPSVCYIMFLWI